MKKSNKLSLFYVLSSVSLLLVLIFGGVYGIYVSVGLSFVRQSASNMTGVPSGAASNVSIGGSVNFNYSMVGIIILSIVLIVLAIFDLVSLIRQIVLFKQFKVVRESVFEKGIEKKVKSKGAVIFLAITIDVISIIIGIIGLFINGRSFVGSNLAWLFYLTDIFIIIFAVVSMILLIIKIRSFKKTISQTKNENKNNDKNKIESNSNFSKLFKPSNYDIDEFEYKLLKLRHMKNTKVISQEEYKLLRGKLLNENNVKAINLNNEKTAGDK